MFTSVSLAWTPAVGRRSCLARSQRRCWAGTSASTSCGLTWSRSTSMCVRQSLQVYHVYMSFHLWMCLRRRVHSPLVIREEPSGIVETRVAKVVRRHKGPSPKSLDLDEKLKPLYTLFCRDIKICRNLRLFSKTLGKKMILLSQIQYLVGRKCMVYIAYYTELKFLWPILLSPKVCQLLPPRTRNFALLLVLPITVK